MIRRVLWKRSAVTIMFTLMAITLTLIVLRLNVNVPIRFGSLRIRFNDLFRPLVFAISIDFVLLVWCWRARWIRLGAWAFLAVFGFLAIVIVARQAGPTLPVADGALTELYTIYATHGQMQLGPYSQFGWHHPGPSLFYLLAPFYLAGGRNTVSLNAGALVINVISLLMVAGIAWRRTSMTPSLGLALVAVPFVYILRAQGLLVSEWNPHIVALPLMALLMMAVAVACGEVRFLPVAVLFASFVSQTHVGLTPTAGGLVLTAIVLTGWKSSTPECRRSLAVWANVAAWLALAMWLLPIAEELTQTPGNATLLWRYFVFAQGRAAPPASDALRAWADMLMAVVRPGFHLPQGWRFEPSAGPWGVMLAMMEMAGLLAVAFWARRSERRFHTALAGLCTLASMAALWSITRIQGDIVDHQIFWISAIGVLNLSVILAALAASADRGFSNQFASRNPFGAAAILFFGFGAAAVGFQQLSAAERDSHTIGHGAQGVRTLIEGITAVRRQLDIRKPLIRIDGDAWGMAAGVVLQLQKDGNPLAMDDYLIQVFGHPLAAAGDEDAEVTFCDAQRHRALAARPNNFVIAQVESIFVDGIKRRH